MKLQNPISKILIPVDGSAHSKQAVLFSGHLGTSFGKSLLGITLLHVTAGSYLSRHMGYRDVRAEIMTQSDAFRKFKDQYIEEHIRPFLDEGEKILKDSGIEVKIEKRVADGEPAHEIVRIADEEDFSTIIMARRGLSELKGLFLGSVTNKVVHSAHRQTVYVVGQKVLKDKRCPVPRILVPVDGSPHSMKVAHHAAGVAERFKPHISAITLLRVINLASYEQRVLKGQDPEQEAKRSLDEAKQAFLEAGLSEGLITAKVRTGRPSEEILEEAEEGNYDLIIMGTKGHGTIRDLILGGTSSAVLHRCQNPTVAIVSSM